ncbi:MAG: ATP-binding protein [Deltaproteobacteria bacterium]|nr:MAG: ATP-binding protein [Deltaproteobacteria bacterium]
MKVELNELGPIRRAELALGGLTVIVGPQATGKSLFVQAVKLALDGDAIATNNRKYGLTWQEDRLHDFLTLVFGEGLGGLWTSRTSLTVDGVCHDVHAHLKPGRSRRKEAMFVVPAQRVLTMNRGWPRPFMDYSPGDPYVVRQFSESLRRLLEAGLGSEDGTLFPRENRLKRELRESFSAAILRDAELAVDGSRLQKRTILRLHGTDIPYMSWSAGQREFIPLLLSLFWLMPSSGATRRQGVECVAIEEPEMGLHPRAVASVLLACLELVYRGYRVILTTHSPQILDLVWALRSMRGSTDPAQHLFDLFDVPATTALRTLARAVIEEREFHVSYFEPGPDGVVARDISSLDPGASEPSEALWGGLTSFSARASEVVAACVNEKEESA